jgi:2-dehydropantoate 2-reductase
MRIGIVGAGAIGGWIGTLLAKDGHDVSVLARGATLAALKSDPWRLHYEGKNIEATVRASNDPSDLGVQDVVVLAVKGPALPAVAPAITRMIGPSTIVVPAMNGVPWWFLLAGAGSLSPHTLISIDPDRTIAGAIGLEAVIGCVVHASATAQPGSVTHTGGKKLILGEPSGNLSERLHALAAMFEHAGFEAVRSEHIQQDIWYKLWGNMTMNPISALTGATCDRILDDELINAFVLRVMAEASEVGKRIGCAINECGEDRIAVTRKLGVFKTSMLQDVEAGRRLEIDQLLAAPREIARLVSVPVPNMDALLGLIRLFARTRGLYAWAANTAFPNTSTP